MCKKLISLLLCLTVLLGAVWVPAGAADVSPSPSPAPKTVTLTFRDKENSNYKPGGLTATAGDNYLLYIEQVAPPTREGYDLAGWYPSTGPDTALIDKYTDKVPDDVGSVILLAKWEPKTYTVTYNENYSGGTTINKTVTYGEEYKKDVDGKETNFPAPPNRNNYNFVGWFTAASGGTQVTADTIVTDAKNHTLYAHWTQKVKQVTLNLNGGKYNNSEANITVEVPLGTSYSGQIARVNPVKEGSKFMGWIVQQDTGDPIVLEKTIAKDEDAQTLYAKWEKAEYTVTLDPNGGNAIDTTNNKFTIRHTQTYADAANGKLSTPPTRTGYTFAGWYTRSTGGDVIANQTYNDLKITTIYAHWTPNQYDLTFDYAFPTPAAWKGADGTTIPTPTHPATMQKGVTYDSTYPPLPTPAPSDIPYYDDTSTDKQYTFEGWYDREKDEVNPSDPTQNKTGQPITGGKNGSIYTSANPGNHTLYARWGYEIEFFANNTKDVTKEEAFSTLKGVTTGKPYNIAEINKLKPKKDGFEFAGWYEGTGNSANKFEPSASDIADGSVKKLYAHWTAAKYSVTFDPQGGELADNPKPDKVTFDSPYGTLTDPKPRTGYTFDGWFTEPEGGTKVTKDTTVATADNHTLYAHWKPVELTLKFDYNFPAGITQDTATHPNINQTTATYGAQYGAALPVNDPLSVTGDNNVTYAFAGWYTTDKDQNGTPEVTGKRVQSSMPVELEYRGSPAAANLYARWKYTVSFYANLDPDADSQSPISGVSLDAVSGSRYGKLPGEPGGNPSKYFLGWFTDPKDDKTKVNESDIANGTTVKLYAHWGSTRTCTIKLDGNGFTLPAGYPTSEIIEYGRDYSKLFNQIAADPVRDGYTFQGWYLNAQGTGSAVTAESTVNGDCTLYAKWKINSLKVTLDLNYGSGSSVKNVDYGTGLNSLLTPEPERTGYAFCGWFTDAKCEFPADPASKVTADITLYAKWMQAKSVSLETGGGTLPSGVAAYINVYEGGTYEKLPEPQWTGCSFLGWYTQENGGALISRDDKVPAAASIPSVLYAHWSPMDVTVTFDPNGSPTNQPNRRTYKVGSKYGVGLGALSWSGYKFMGWYTMPAGGEKITADTVIAVKSNDELELTVYAHWGYEVSFNPAEGSGSMDPQVAEMNQPYTLPVCTFEPPLGMRFGGWAPGDPSAAVTYPGGSQYTVSRRVTFYATWTTAPIVITASCTSGGRLVTEDGQTNEVEVKRGDNITFMAVPNDGYVLKELLVDGVTCNFTDIFTFREVSEDHTIHAVFEKIGPPSYSTCDHGGSCPLSLYRDLDAGAWYHDAIHYCVDGVIMGGTGTDRFYPGRTLSRGELAVCLYNYQGRPPVAGSGPLPATYNDVKPGQWHYQAIEWATAKGILKGVGNNSFKPDQSITREQLITILWRHAGSPRPRSTTLRYYDSSSVSDFAWEAMCWGTEQHILQGRSTGYLVPQGTATRAEAAEMLKNYLT